MTPQELVTGLVELLRARGLKVSPSSASDLVEALSLIGVTDEALVREAARIIVVKSVQDDEVFERGFVEYFYGARDGDDVTIPREISVGLDSDDTGESGIEESDEAQRVVRYSAVERLRTVDLRTLEPAERQEAFRLIEQFRFSPPRRRSYRYTRSSKMDRLDLSRTLRLSVSTGGELVRRRFQSRSVHYRRLLFLVDISGSMHAYAEGLLHFAWAARRALGDVHVFTLGTRLSDVSRALDVVDPDQAMRRVALAVEDFAGGTRLGSSLADFNVNYGARGLARGAVVVVFSDGWDRGDPQVMAEAMGRLARLAHTILWVNPLAAASDYAPLARGMATALPYIDALLPGESIRSFEQLARLVCSEGEFS
ncbi:MAG: vWA domain-containing protein [Ferrimicrobium sp.]|uniref:VWA domain-containing protein n=1 Tax=Ferrimicrobium acidiphilum TaxID=121039 RepID=A0ABV3XY94_9ACTN|nr:VWA domain-containing protein [Ferrimicrobium sp.]MCL5973177.1 VWA domain-containing protein [Actinomycetota bacterium]